MKMDPVLPVKKENPDTNQICAKYPSYPKVAASVIAKDSGNWFSTFTIDKGKNLKVEPFGGYTISLALQVVKNWFL